MTPEEHSVLIEKIRTFPAQLEAMLWDLTHEQLTTSFLAGEWSAAQNVHHLADSHMNAFIRFKLILLEDNPTLKPYNQNDWAETVDAQETDIENSLSILRGLHRRWASLMESLSDEQWARSGYHPENKRQVTLESILEYYAAHGEGHIDQINRTLAAQG